MQAAQLTPRRPTALVVLAILCLLFGGLGLFGTASTIVLLKSGMMEYFNELNKTNPGAVKGLSAPEIEARLAERVPSYEPAQYVAMSVDGLASLVLVVGGLALLRLKRWGWYLLLSYAALQLAFKVGYWIYYLIWVAPEMKAVLADIKLQAGPGFQSAVVNLSMESGTAAGLAAGLMTPVFPLLVLFLLYLCPPSHYRPRRFGEPAVGPDTSAK